MPDIPFIPPWMQGPLFLVLLPLLILIKLSFFFAVSYLVLSWPIRSRERARLLLELLDQGLQRGLTPSQALSDPTQSSDRIFGFRYRTVASELAHGNSLHQALHSAPSLLPPNIASLLTLGEKTNTLRQIIPICKNSLQDASSRFRASRNFLLTFSLLMLPVSFLLLAVLRIFIAPKYSEIFHDMFGPGITLVPALPHPTYLFFPYEILLLVLTLTLIVSSIAGPWIVRALRAFHIHSIDRLFWLTPWCRKRLLRDFTQSLTVLLDAGIPEAQALQWAGEHQANSFLKKQSLLASIRLQNGEKLLEVLKSWDQTGELSWRLKNASMSPSPLRESLEGWWRSLDIAAFRQEQIASQCLACSLILLNGLLVGNTALSVVQAQTTLIEHAVLW